MSAPAIQQHQQQKQPAAVTTPGEEALKRNTDCVYFLASPLTCKKGSECEYRHSEYVRVNPRDCYFWLNGNCLNPKCGFRHPPLDGLLGNQGGASAGSVHSSHAQAHQNAGTQAVPCVFFQKAMCIKGDRCAFLHVLNVNKTQQPIEATLEDAAEEKNVHSVNFSKTAESKVLPLGDGRDTERYVPEHVQTKAVGVVPSFQHVQTHVSDDNISSHYGRDIDEVLRESSPGFDVLVDNELSDSEYYHGEDQFGQRGEDGRNSVNGYNHDYGAVADGDSEAFCDHRGFDRYDHMQDRQYGWGHHRDSSERRPYSKDERSVPIPESDLRYRLSKQRRGNGVRSGGGHGYSDSRRDKLQESSISSRLRGRIKLPGEVVNGGDEGQFERGARTPWARQGRLQDRIRGRLEESYGGDVERGSRSPWGRRREMEDDRYKESSGNKRQVKEEPSLRKRKSLEDHRHQRCEDSFVAPLPLSEILKRKRTVTASEQEQEVGDGETGKKGSGDDLKLTEEDKTEIGCDELSEPKETHEAETEEGTMVEDQTYEQNGEYYYEEEEGYEEGVEEEEYEEGGEGDGENDFAKKMDVMLS